MNEATTVRPEYVTDGSHIYLWHPEFEPLFETGQLKASGPPEPPKVKKLSMREATKIEEMRKKALVDAEKQVKILQNAQAKGQDLTSLFGEEPKGE